MLQVTAPQLGIGNVSGIDLIVMENLLYQREVSCVFDLKGSCGERYVDKSNDNAVLLDGNLEEANAKCPTTVSSFDFRRLCEVLRYDTGTNLATFFGAGLSPYIIDSLFDDAEFLGKCRVMDYSLLMICNNDEIAVGIIDYLRQYTWDKHIESWVKSNALLRSSPTVISPDEYAQRFRSSIMSYFTEVPCLFTRK